MYPSYRRSLARHKHASLAKRSFYEVLGHKKPYLLGIVLNVPRKKTKNTRIARLDFKYKKAIQTDNKKKLKQRGLQDELGECNIQHIPYSILIRS